MVNYSTITSDKSKNTALILCVAGGLMGLHHFYVGNIGKGMLYMFTGGLFIFGWIADIIKISTGGFKDNSGAPLRKYEIWFSFFILQFTHSIFLLFTLLPPPLDFSVSYSDVPIPFPN